MILEDGGRGRSRRATVVVLATAVLLAVSGFTAAGAQASTGDAEPSWNNTISDTPPPSSAS
ncbi:hypothetical protein [Amycolatopsis sp. lyj-90]|uniref:hypothetical protein n=1 Tax=Amycolatopsis sp. lyj-90 TaxID=2789285 RepID=UPI00397D6F4F